MISKFSINKVRLAFCMAQFLLQFLEEKTKDTHNLNANIYTLIMLRFYIIINNWFTILKGMNNCFFSSCSLLPAFSCYLLPVIYITFLFGSLWIYCFFSNQREVVFLFLFLIQITFKNWLINLYTSHKSLARANFRVSFPLLC